MKRAKRRPARAGVASTVAPPARFRSDVGRAWGWTCVVCGAEGTADGQFDPAHLIPAQMIRREANTVPALGDYVYDPRLAVWCCRACHFGHDYRANGPATLTREVLVRCGAWDQLADVVLEMDCLIPGKVGRDDGSADWSVMPFTAYLGRTFP